MRYNDSTDVFEGYINSWIPLQGVYDSDLDTYINVDIPGDTDNMKFYTRGSLAIQIKENQRTLFRENVEMYPYKGIVFSDQLWSGGPGTPTPVPEIERILSDYRTNYGRTGMTARGAGTALQLNWFHNGVITSPVIVKSANTYSKIGMAVMFNLHLEFRITANMQTVNGPTDSPLYIQTLPFNGYTTGNHIFTCATEGINIPSGAVQVVGVLEYNGQTSKIAIKAVMSNGAMIPINLSDCIRDGINTNTIYLNGYYTTQRHSFDDPNATIVQNPGGTTGGPITSDSRLKDNIIRIQNPVEKLNQLNGYTFNWKEEAYDLEEGLPTNDVGVIAQEVEAVFPESIVETEVGVKQVRYHTLIPLLIEVVKEQQARIEKLESIINA